MRKPINTYFFVSAFILMFFSSCTKNDQPSPSVIPADVPIKSIEIIFPQYAQYFDNPKIKFFFTADSLRSGINDYDIYTISTIDSMVDKYTHKVFETKKSFFVTKFPRRLSHMTFRSHDAVQGFPNYSLPRHNYDLKVTYKNNGMNVGKIDFINYSDYEGTSVRSRQEYDLEVYPGGYDHYFSTDSFIYRSHIAYRQQNIWREKGSLSHLTQRYIQSVNNDTSEESREFDPNRTYKSLFFKSIPFFYEDGHTFHRYNYNHLGYLKTYVVVLGEDLFAFSRNSKAKHKITYTYNSDSAATNQITRKLFNMSSLYFLKIAGHNVPRANRPEEWYGEIYYPEPYAVFKDIASSYTDSLFSVDQSLKPVFISTKKYTNTITKNNRGNIVKITRADDAGTTIKIINIFY